MHGAFKVSADTFNRVVGFGNLDLRMLSSEFGNGFTHLFNHFDFTRPPNTCDLETYNRFAIQRGIGRTFRNGVIDLCNLIKAYMSSSGQGNINQPQLFCGIYPPKRTHRLNTAIDIATATGSILLHLA